MNMRYASRLATIVILSLIFVQTHCQFFDDKDKERTRDTNLLALLVLAYLSNPCNRVAPPGANAGAPTSSALLNVGSLRGRVQDTDGTPVLNALVLVEDGPQSADSTYFSSHSSLSADGSFEIAGIPVGSTYKVSVEPINTAYYSRIDTHIDCFLSPTTFQYGWFAGDGVTAARTFNGAATLATATNGRTHIGTLKVSR